MVKGKTFKPRKRPIDARIEKYRRFERFFEQRVRTAREVAWPNECSVTNLMLLQERATPGRSKALTGIAARRLERSHREIIQRILDALPEREQKQLARAMSTIRRILGRGEG